MIKFNVVIGDFTISSESVFLKKDGFEIDMRICVFDKNDGRKIHHRSHRLRFNKAPVLPSLFLFCRNNNRVPFTRSIITFPSTPRERDGTKRDGTSRQVVSIIALLSRGNISIKPGCGKVHSVFSHTLRAL